MRIAGDFFRSNFIPLKIIYIFIGKKSRLAPQVVKTKSNNRQRDQRLGGYCFIVT